MKTVWGVRHVRWAWAFWRCTLFWLSLDEQRWLASDQTDAEYLNAIWRGKA